MVHRVSPEAYLALERVALERSEYIDGVIVKLPGAGLSHATITANLGGLIWFQLRGSACQSLTCSMKVCTPLRTMFSYPDVTVVCGTPEYHDKLKDVLTNPRVIFEVLSPSTEYFDSGKKRRMYQTLASLTDYLLVAQDEPLVEHWKKETDTTWTVRFVTGLDAEVSIDNIHCTLRLAEIYERVTFP